MPRSLFGRHTGNVSSRNSETDIASDLLKQLLDLDQNLAVAARIEKADPVTAPGIPPDYPDPKSLFTDDCIQP